MQRRSQRISFNLLEYISRSISSATGVTGKYVFFIMDHLICLAMLIAIPHTSATAIGNALIDRVIICFGAPETLHLGQGPKFENKVICQLQIILGFHKVRTTPYSPQGNSVSERVHSTMYTMLAMQSSIEQDNWVTVLPFVQLAYDTSFSTTVMKYPSFDVRR